MVTRGDGVGTPLSSGVDGGAGRSDMKDTVGSYAKSSLLSWLSQNDVWRCGVYSSV